MSKKEREREEKERRAGEREETEKKEAERKEVLRKREEKRERERKRGVIEVGQETPKPRALVTESKKRGSSTRFFFLFLIARQFSRKVKKLSLGKNRTKTKQPERKTLQKATKIIRNVRFGFGNRFRKRFTLPRNKFWANSERQKVC